MEKMSLPKIAQRIPDESAAYEFMEELRWHSRPVCPHCGSISEHYFLTPRNGGRISSRGKVSNRRLWKCCDCRKQFSVLTGTIMHGTHVPVRTWVLVIFEMVSSKNGVASREIERKYGLSPKTAWFLLHRIREGMRRDPVASLFSGVVVADETWIGGAPKNRHANKRNPNARQGLTDKTPVVSLISAETGEIRSKVVANVSGASLRSVIAEHAQMAATTLHTDASGAYGTFAHELTAHESVNHAAGEYVRDGVSTNRAENYFSQLKRSIDGTHHHVSPEHLPRYLSEF
ncbi:MAG: IS1595 family transposase, partial [Acidimicrobiales bacterium]